MKKIIALALLTGLVSISTSSMAADEEVYGMMGYQKIDNGQVVGSGMMTNGGMEQAVDKSKVAEAKKDKKLAAEAKTK